MQVLTRVLGWRVEGNQNGILNPKGSTRAEFAPFSHEPGLE